MTQNSNKTMNPEVTQVLERLKAHAEDLQYVIAKTLNNPTEVYQQWFVNELEYLLACVALLEELAYVDLTTKQQDILGKAQYIALNIKVHKHD